MTDGADSDEALMLRFAGGDVHAFEELYRRHELRVHIAQLDEVGFVESRAQQHASRYDQRLHQEFAEDGGRQRQP